MNLNESSSRLGALRAVELECFRLLGERAPQLEPPGCARWAASAALAHAWRSSLLEELLPVSVGLAGPGELTVLPEGDLGAELARALSVPGEGAGDAGSKGGSGGARASDGLVLVEDLVGGLYPLLLAEYARCLGRCSPAADGAALRTLGRAVADLRAVREEGSLLRAAGGSTGGR